MNSDWELEDDVAKGIVDDDETEQSGPFEDPDSWHDELASE